jgi:outer membrane protein OmpA-like peptidoglycan-associated protein
MKLSHVFAPALAALLATACASSSQQAANDRAAQAEVDRDRARDDARKAEINAEKARADARDAARAQYEADQRAHFASQSAAQAEHDAQVERGVAEPQPGDGRVTTGVWSPGVGFAVSSADLTNDDKTRLSDVAESLREHPSQRVIVEGYSDDVNVDGQLSHRRADCVAHYLEKRGVSGDRITTRVTSRNAVRYAGEDPSHHALNRGVEIYIN